MNDFSYVSSSDNSFIDSLYSDYKKNPDTVDMSWRQFFKGVDFALTMPAACRFKGQGLLYVK